MDVFPFEIVTREIAFGVNLLYFDIENLSGAISYLDEHIVSIFWGAEADESLEDTKLCLSDLFSTRLSDNSWLHGATAELFAHLLLNHKGYKQDCLYQNLEERSIKKGFDGVYSIGDSLWLMESKSGLFNGGFSHYDKVIEAANDLAKKVSGRDGKNNPWKNAYHHASQIDVDANPSIRSQIKELSRQYQRGSYEDISSFNIIPCSTLFYEGPIEKEELDSLIVKLRTYFSKRGHEEVAVVCISNAALDDFLSYLELRRDSGK